MTFFIYTERIFGVGMKKMRNIVDNILMLKFILSPFHPYVRQAGGVPVGGGWIENILNFSVNKNPDYDLLGFQEIIIALCLDHNIKSN